MPERKGEYKVFQAVIEGHRRKPNIRVQLPASVKSILRKPADELSWSRLEEVRRAVAVEALCERLFHLSADELIKLAESIRTNKSRQRRFTDEVGAFQREAGLDPIPKGSRVMLACRQDDSREWTADEVWQEVIGHAEYEPLRIRLRPLKTRREPSLDRFGKMICTSEEQIESIAAAEDISINECLDRLLLVLWDALMLTMSEEWTRKGVANLACCEAPELARYFLAGLQVGSRPPFDGICSMCGALLHGLLQQSQGNQHAGPPRTGTVMS